jgi:hypothetical protein
VSDAAKIVEDYLRVLMIPDPEAARRYCAPDMEIRFSGNRLMRDPSECASFNRGRYVRRGKIVQMEVWNDSAEWLLVRAGLAKP